MGSTWRVFSQTNDEPAHIAAGMEWLERGRYTYEPKHPPLPRILFALGVAVEVVPPNPGDRLWLVVVEPGSDPAVVRFHSSKPSE